jgi:hypothetical protein
MADQLPASTVTVNGVHPGTFMPIKIVLEDRGTSVDDLHTGVVSVRRLVSEPGLLGTTGSFFDHTREAEADPQAYGRQARSGCGVAASNWLTPPNHSLLLLACLEQRRSNLPDGRARPR